MKKTLLSLVAFAAPFLAQAADFNSKVKTVNTSDDVIKALSGITNWIFSGFLTVAVLVVLYAAYQFLMAQGNSEKFDQAKKSLIYAAIAIAIAVLAKSIVSVAARIAGGSVDLK